MHFSISSYLYKIAENWSDKVRTKKIRQEGVFLGKAPEIVRYLSSISKNPNQALKKLLFYINRGGSNIDSKQMKNLDGAKSILQKQIKKDK